MLHSSKPAISVPSTLLEMITASIEHVIPLSVTVEAVQPLEQVLTLRFGVLIGITGDMKGKLLLTGESSVFGAIGETMFGMPIEGEMLHSFSGELGNMIGGNFSTNLMQEAIKTDITAPTIMQGDTSLSGYEKAYRLPCTFADAGTMTIYMLLDETNRKRETLTRQQIRTIPPECTENHEEPKVSLEIEQRIRRNGRIHL
ncbi:chemotaxis protein CheX [Bacillus piscicola]|uniref:chemotaxis protein CheX n=1 Tax=Bacillus piscicola TaxID=1632684 RepID=UPI001F08B121|nr:chemotaxis protein CheX [Bacillus piscicola]